MRLTLLLVTLQAGLLMAQPSNSGCEGGCPNKYECLRGSLCNDPYGCAPDSLKPYYSCVRTGTYQPSDSGCGGGCPELYECQRRGSLCNDPYGCTPGQGESYYTCVQTVKYCEDPHGCPG
ncbi:uncharacterized protein N7503_000906 [Penicillium pulvis]|uniref:uncharacterized protein n=1 Tax=Penicillium pulvis TaxID=1562058 RepID=UPI0025471BB6|nr:uncharacterized protein N7503_000906 [Penicillium pulvis]KAJ5814156.1 hypothetical protein N7503_000906 [Penicillium pulvis]